MNPSDSRRARKNLELLGKMLPRGKRILVIPHDYPDPDALASAAAMHLLLDKYFGLHSQIVFSGQVSRAENKELLRRLRFRWHRLENLREPRRTTAAVIVDSTPWSRNVTIPTFAKPVAVIDHHRHVSVVKSRGLFMDIRGGTGASTTIAYEYLKAANIPIPRWLAAIMAYAIASETLDLSRDSDEDDLAAYIELAGKADLKIIGKIRHASLPRAYFSRLKEAITNARKVGSLAWTHLQVTEQPEIIAEVADLLLRMEGIRWSFCTAYMNGGMYVSLRSNQRRAACSRILRSAIGRDGSAGGHDRMAAGYLDMSRLSYRQKQEKKKEFHKSLIRKLARRLIKDVEDVESITQPLAEPRITAKKKNSKSRK